MKSDANTPRVSTTIQGIILTMIAPFVAGYAINANEAAALNQLLTENIRNNFASQIKARADKGEPVDVDTLQPMLDSYVSEYEFGVRRSGGSVDPIEREARAIVTEAVKAALAAKGIKQKDVSKEDFEKHVAGVLADPVKGENVRKKAAQVIKARNAISAAELEIAV